MAASRLKIVADENIPFVREAFGPYGEVKRLPGYGITSAEARQADALLVRSVTRVDRGLLDGSSVRFVASATIGTDHIDAAYLASRGIALAHAPGSNADSVVEYVLAALYAVAVQRRDVMRGKTVGIVGCGNIGSRLARRLPALGLRILKHDPPLAEAAGQAGGAHDFVSLERLLGESDIVTLHVPLTKSGPYATWHRFDAHTLGMMKPGAWLVNTCRGAVVDNLALRARAEAGHLGAVIMDVWEHEPTPDPELVHRVDVATPHIAGYSYDGKIQGTVMIYHAFLEHFALGPAWEVGQALGTEGDVIDLAAPYPSLPETVWLDALLRQMYEIRADDRRMRGLLTAPPGEEGRYFNDLRKRYPRRRTFSLFRLSDNALPAEYREAVREALHVQ